MSRVANRRSIRAFRESSNGWAAALCTLDIVLFAAKREKAAFDLYTDLARIYVSIPDIKKIFDVLAQEEAYHKLKLEREYDEVVYKED